ncbi:MAG: phenylalanine--tRNA ligase subunit beta [Candidatus Komeilibacteria bacterium]|nr:phenylalanine--tRNA ligase subunit beta [Candidatus Komeilibacteria bacterium]
MKISLNWLKQYIDLPKSLTAQELALKLTMSTVEVEDVVDEKNRYANMVVGEVLEIVPHPQADKLTVLKVKAGKSVYQVICGAGNVYKGMKGVLALPGSLVKWHNMGESVKLEKTKIRGIESEGMMCAPSEIGLSEEFQETDGVIDLKEGKSGQEIAEVLGLNDIVLEIDNKSITNRPDLWGHYGLAREIAALYNLKLKDLKIDKIKEGDQVNLKIDIQDEANCSRYMSLVVTGIKIEPSPVWMQRLLQAAGVRPINNIVDITNFVMLELGRPSHAFDRRDILGDTIIVRRAKAGEKMKTLDGQERTLTDQMCLVCDSAKPVDLGGIMGGANSEIKPDTTEIILELANFNPINIRKTAQALNLRTEAAIRFEKSLDPALAELGLKRIVTLVQELIPQVQVASKIMDVNLAKQEERLIELNLDFLNKRVGQNIPKKEVIGILGRLSFIIKDKGETLLVTPPSFRVAKDISIPEDLVEEVARVYGYNNIQAIMPEAAMCFWEENHNLILNRKVKDILTLGCGAAEAYNYSFTGLKNITALGLPASDHFELANYLSEDCKYLRLSLFENLIKNLEDNFRFARNFNIFELGRVFAKGVGEYAVDNKQQAFLAKQERFLAGLAVSQAAEPFYQVKGLVETLLNALEINYSYGEQGKIKSNCPSFVNPERYLEFKVGDLVLGWVAELRLEILNNLNINAGVGVWQLSFELLLKYFQDNKKYRSAPKFPGMVYDLAVAVPASVTWAEIRQEVLETSKLIRRVELFDVFKLEKLGPNLKSLAFHAYFLDENKTLTAEEADKIRDKIINLLKKKFKAEIR